MELHEIAQEDHSLKTQLADLVQQRYQAKPQGRYNFLSGELATIKNMPASQVMITAVQSLLQEYLTANLQNSYCYYSLKSLLCETGESKCAFLMAQQVELVRKKSTALHRMNHLAVMRQALLVKLIQRGAQVSDEAMEDIRFVTAEIISEFVGWKQVIRDRGLYQSIVYVYKGNNYLTKMITDTEPVLQMPNIKQSLYHPTCNPFLVPIKGTPGGITQQKINQCQEVLAQQKAVELRMMIASTYLKTSKNVSLEQQVKMLKTRIDQSKTQQIKTIYQGKWNDSKDKSEGQTVNFRASRMIAKNQSSVKKLDQIIKARQIEVLRQMNRKGKNKETQAISSRQVPANTNSDYRNKINSLRQEVQKNIKMAKETKKKPLPHRQADIKAAKPKIKLITERETTIENIVNKGVLGVLDIMSTSAANFSSSASKLPPAQQTSKPKLTVMRSSTLTYRPRSKSTTGLSFKVRKASASKQKEKEKEKSQQKSRQQEISQIKDSLTALNKRIKQQNIQSIYGKARVTKSVFQYKPEQKSANLSQQLQASKVESKAVPVDPLGQTNTFAQRMKQKQRNIQQLKGRLKQMKSADDGEAAWQSLMRGRQLQQQRIHEQRSKLQLQNMRIKQEMEAEQARFLQLKQKQYQLREEEMVVKYRGELSKVRQELADRNRHYQLQIQQERKKNQQNQQKMKEIAVQAQRANRQLLEKQLREQLMKQLIEQQKKRAQQQLIQQQMSPLLHTIKLQQQHYQLQLEKRAVENYQQEKLKLEELYLQMQRQNQLMEAQNKQRQLQLAHIQQENSVQQTQLTELQKTLQETHQAITYRQFLDENKQKQTQQRQKVQKTMQKQVRPEQMNQNDLEELKEKLKQQLVQAMRQRQKQQAQEQRRYQQEKKLMMTMLQEQLRKAMKMQEQQLQNMQQEYRIKSQLLLQEHNRQLEMQAAAKKAIQQQSANRIQNAGHNSQLFDLKPVINTQNVSKNLQKTPIKSIVPSSPPKKTENQQSQKQNLIQILPKSKELEKNDRLIEQKPQTLKPDVKIQQFSPTKSIVSQHPAIPQVAPISNVNEPIQTLGIDALGGNNQNAPKQSIGQSGVQVRDKYEAALAGIPKKAKQIYIPYEDIDSYLQKFYAQLSPQVKQMLPFAPRQIQAIFKQKKVDIFQGYSFGVYRPKQAKFTLVGGIQCVPAIASKYGQIQIQRLFIFDKSNPHQKQYLSKQVKLYQKIGYVFQKKNQQGKFTIKLVIKVPKNSQHAPSLTDTLQISNSVAFVKGKNPDSEAGQLFCWQYLISQGFKHYLSEQQKVTVAGRGDLESIAINKKINEKAFECAWVHTQQSGNNSTQVQINLPLKHMQTIQHPLFSLSARQFTIGTSQQKLYMSHFKDQQLAVIVYQMQKKDISQDFTLETYIQSKFRKLQEVGQIHLLVPFWRSRQSWQYQAGGVECSLKHETNPNFNLGSIVRNKVQKGNFMFVQGSFAFLIFQISEKQVLRRMIHGQLVDQSQIVKNKLQL